MMCNQMNERRRKKLDVDIKRDGVEREKKLIKVSPS